jgi:uncharacterized protein (DUF305 family)
MKQNTILIAVIALLVGGIGGYFLIDRDDYTMNGMDHSMMMSNESNEDMDDMPMGGRMGMDHSAMMVSSEREFLTGMIPHHQEAVDTAKEVVERGGSTPEIKTLAENIIIAQELEIAEMKQWHLDWYGEEYVADDSYQPMMRELADLSGAELDQRFLEDMVMHHMGAIMMARSVQPHIEHQEIEVLSKAIVETQTAEIDLMRDLLSGL